MEIDRRRFLSRSARCAGALLAALTVPGAIAASSTRGKPPEWGYGSTDGPEEWGSLWPGWRVCDTGMEQTPINLPRVRPGAPVRATVRVRYRPGPVQVLDTGHAVKFLPGGGNRALIDGTEFTLVQFHDHNPSEHTRGGRHYPAELHFVHASETGDLAVLGILLRTSARGGPADELLDALPADPAAKERIARSFDVARFFPRDGVAFRYAGSLTTPDCRQGVDWFVFATPLPVKPEVIETFRRANPDNFRPVQPLGSREILSARIRS